MADKTTGPTLPQRPKDAARQTLRAAVRAALDAGLYPETVVGFVQGEFADEPLVTVTVSQARAALWVVENCDFTGRKHDDARAFVGAVKDQGVDLSAPREAPDATG